MCYERPWGEGELQVGVAYGLDDEVRGILGDGLDDDVERDPPHLLPRGGVDVDDARGVGKEKLSSLDVEHSSLLVHQRRTQHLLRVAQKLLPASIHSRAL
jgi:hypothetical protein